MDHIIGEVQFSIVDHYGVILGCHNSIGFIVKNNGLCVIVHICRQPSVCHDKQWWGNNYGGQSKEGS